MSRTLAHNTEKTPLSELERGLTALYLEAPATVADDIKQLAHAAITAAETAAEARGAERMRERCVKVAQNAASTREIFAHRWLAEEIADGIRALPLEEENSAL